MITVIMPINAVLFGSTWQRRVILFIRYFDDILQRIIGRANEFRRLISSLLDLLVKAGMVVYQITSIVICNNGVNANDL